MTQNIGDMGQCGIGVLMVLYLLAGGSVVNFARVRLFGCVASHCGAQS